MSLLDKASQYTDDIVSIRGGVFVFGKLCLIAAVGLAYETGLTLHNAQRAQIKSSLPSAIEAEIDEQIDSTLDSYKIITTRNIFGVVSSPAPVRTVTAPVSQLKLRLVGTNVSKGQEPFAIVENEQTKEQDIFELNENMFGQATLVKVMAESVQIKFGGKLETLVLTEGDSSSSPEPDSGIASSDDGSEFIVAEAEVNNALANLPRLLSQARAVPYFKNGESVGMRLFAIRRGSLYEKLGLKNGDILKAVNGNSLSDPTQALKIFEQLKSERSINVRVERGGSERNLNYEIR
ncbi:MAG: hypothetical protein KDD66_09725 [Bdellovibrionales bacterium]|nr:hypothetical protein [Bdellovibrionales bacterium]